MKLESFIYESTMVSSSREMGILVDHGYSSVFYKSNATGGMEKLSVARNNTGFRFNFPAKDSILVANCFGVDFYLDGSGLGANNSDAFVPAWMVR
eukprot:5361414-Lingulodinium_polyedra.AAC.1